ncbi:MAG: HipA domain-containing protein, partial [Bacteroidota bacterium]
RELWRRIVFSVAISNTDDHLRNHGFLLDKSGWRLSPAYDINPTPRGTGLSLNISEEDNNLDFDLCLEVIDFFRWKAAEATKFIEQTKQITSQWKERARRLNISHEEQSSMENAFVK